MGWGFSRFELAGWAGFELSGQAGKGIQYPLFFFLTIFSNFRI